MKTSMPARWLSMKPCRLTGSGSWPRTTFQPSEPTAAATAASSRCCTGQQVTLALGRRSPLAMVWTTPGSAAGGCMGVGRE
ncbi:hypothetical protein [Actinacidiphila acidipaludis]|uniref:hypothetical protein n=1 Tax=Actinacidiphila acidipaludis TaxID=2873382 RepID=UPI00223B29C4|nr:hypothetical protein [Streptomyces acidipaludis]